jgi:hypothetical protein
MSVSSGQACSTGAATVNSLVSSMGQSPFRVVMRAQARQRLERRLIAAPPICLYDVT